MRARVLTASMMTLAVIGLSGCAIGAGSGRTADEAGQDFLRVIDDTQHVVGGEWEIRDDPTSRGCAIPLWVEGEHYPALRVGTLPSAPGAALDLVEELWTELGYRIDTNRVGDATELQATGQHDEKFIFRVSDSGMTLQGESECRPD